MNCKKLNFSNAETLDMWFSGFDDIHIDGWYELGYSDEDSHLGWDGQALREHFEDLRNVDPFYELVYPKSFLKKVNFDEISTFINFI
jgi:hypothetical protein